MIFEKRCFKSVSSSSSYTDEYTPANGETIYITEFGGSACLNNNVKVQIKWDTEILFVTHACGVHRSYYQISGDGSKKLTIELINDSDQTETIGGYYYGEQYGV